MLLERLLACSGRFGCICRQFFVQPSGHEFRRFGAEGFAKKPRDPYRRRYREGYPKGRCEVAEHQVHDIDGKKEHVPEDASKNACGQTAPVHEAASDAHVVDPDRKRNK